MDASTIGKMPEAEREELLVAALDYLAEVTTSGGILPPQVFEAGMHFRPAVFGEIVNLYEDEDGTLFVLLAKRPDNDPNWPLQLHSPGKFWRNTWTLEDLIREQAKIDEAGVGFPERPMFAGTLNFFDKERGHGTTVIFMRRVREKLETLSPSVKWYRVADLESLPVIAGQRTLTLPLALSVFNSGPPRFIEDVTTYA